jgi:hypothetical protein
MPKKHMSVTPSATHLFHLECWGTISSPGNGSGKRAQTSRTQVMMMLLSFIYFITGPDYTKKYYCYQAYRKFY